MSEIYAVNESFFKMILSRHSLGAKHLVIPAPDVGALRLAVTAACRVPCHQETLPFRWVEISSRDRLADLFESVLPADADEEMRAKARGKALKAPMCMALVGTGLSPDSQDRDADERLMTAGASLMNFLAGLHAQGFAAKAVSAKDFPAPRRPLRSDLRAPALLRARGNARHARQLSGHRHGQRRTPAALPLVGRQRLSPAARMPSSEARMSRSVRGASPSASSPAST